MIYSSSVVLEKPRNYMGQVLGPLVAWIRFSVDSPFYSATVVDEQGSRDCDVDIDVDSVVVSFEPRFNKFKIFPDGAGAVSFDLEDLVKEASSGSGGSSSGGTTVRTSKNLLLNYWLGEGEE